MRFKVRFGSGPAPVEQSTAPQPDGWASPTARYLAMAHAMERRLRNGTFADYADAGKWLGVTPARANMLAHLVLLAPAIQEAILLGDLAVSEHVLRGVCRVAGWDEQRQPYCRLFAQDDDNAKLAPVISDPIMERCSSHLRVHLSE
jgi:hypothetical protein